MYNIKIKSIILQKLWPKVNYLILEFRFAISFNYIAKNQVVHILKIPCKYINFNTIRIVCHN